MAVMQRSSSSIASLAAALAKAQAELTNPEKSLVATIRPQYRGEAERSFRYAPLSSGLDIVRKTLGQHEIATVQTTAIDQTAGTVNLTTMLAHASGEWIASDWPVCAISETATPHRMGAALTYARRYALFALVGIAGEDDLDAPDLATPTQQTSRPEEPKGDRDNRLNGGQFNAPQQATVRHYGKVRSNLAAPMLPPEASAELRDRLLAELKDIGDGDDAATWAHRRLGEKNGLTTADARCVDESFQGRLATIATRVADDEQMGGKAGKSSTPHDPHSDEPKRNSRSAVIDKSGLALPEPRRLRDRDHVRFVAKQPCLVCGRRPSDTHHLRFAQSRALGRKVSDEFTVPLCRGHHREVHRYGDEAMWWRTAGIDPTEAARSLWLETHPLAIGADHPVVDAADPLASDPTVRQPSKRPRRIKGLRANRKAKLAVDSERHGVA
jgi:hypothetical protein